ncbi:hypothetical protein G7046_g2769 [Stylonectria norvegica]|nr:hypothetical protein G7046_g2769 [Stylonectria norvegica]
MDSSPMNTAVNDPKYLHLPNGRALAYCLYGSSSPTHHIFYFHSYPGSRLEGALLHEAAASQNLQLICPDRPGMGSSTFVPGRRIVDWPLDVLALADHLGIPQFACIGTSGGGPYAVACYRQIPRSRLKIATVLSGLWPTWLGTRGMLPETKALLFLAPWVPSALIAKMFDYSIGRAARDPEQSGIFEATVTQLFESTPMVDRDIWTQDIGGFREMFLANMREALKNGASGSAREAKLYGSDWGFSLKDVKVEKDTLLIWHGGLDRNVPFAMAEKASACLFGCNFTAFPEEGHVSLLANKNHELLEQTRKMLEG